MPERDVVLLEDVASAYLQRATDRVRALLLVEADSWEGTDGHRAKRLREAEALLARASGLIQSAYATRGRR